MNIWQTTFNILLEISAWIVDRDTCIILKSTLLNAKLTTWLVTLQVGPSVAFDAASMNELRKWNEQYGEGGSRRKSPFGFGN